MMPPQPVIVVLPPSSVAVLIHGRNDAPIASSPPRPASAPIPRRVTAGSARRAVMVADGTLRPHFLLI